MTPKLILPIIQGAISVLVRHLAGFWLFGDLYNGGFAANECFTTGVF